MLRNLLSPLLPGVFAAAALTLGACSEPTSTAPELARGSSAPLTLSPSRLELTSPGLSTSLTATVQYSGLLTANTSNSRCATVSPTSATAREKPAESSVYVAQFTVTPGGPGSCTVSVADKKGNVAFAGVHVVLARIAYSHPVETPVAAYQIYVMDPDGQNKTRVSNSSFNEYQAAWSPDRTRIAFTVLDFGGEEIYVMDADGQNRTRLTNNASHDHAPAWSPDGTRIAFMSERDGNSEIYVMDADGQNQTRLTNNPALDDRPAWSPDGTKIAFDSNRDGNLVVYVMDANGQNQTPLQGGSDPAWSPDGTRIAYSSSSQIYVMDASGQNATQLTFGQEEEKPTWSPDGTRIGWECTFIDRICVMDADGQNQTALTDGSAEERDPAWR
jgi:Tol biopolymer transport system component